MATIEERRAALLELAECVAVDSSSFVPVLDMLVPPLAAASVLQPVPLFDQLLAAVKEQQEFHADPITWLKERGYGTPEEFEANQATDLQADVTLALNVLMGWRE